jgi:hypothetical protein
MGKTSSSSSRTGMHSFIFILTKGVTHLHPVTKSVT